MAVRFVFGRGGTGKTAYCIGRIVSALAQAGDDSRLVLLVPEQASFQAESLILSHPEIKGYTRLSIVSFDRLDYLLGDSGPGKARLSKLSGQMIIHRILRQQRHKLRVFGDCAGRQGLGRQMSAVISEFLRYGTEPADIDALAERLDNSQAGELTVAKYADIALVMRGYLEFIEGRFIDSDLELARLRERITDSGIFDGARLWVDGFSGFTAAESAVLVQMVGACDYAEIALCLDPGAMDARGPGNPTSLFYPTELTYLNLKDRFERAGLAIDKPIILKKAQRFSGSPALAHLQSNLFRLGAEKTHAAGSVRLVSCPGVRAEVRYIARQVLELVTKHGFRYRDIAVILPDMELYEPYVGAIFADYELPYFVDKKQPLNHHGAVVFILSALKAALEGFGNSDVLGYLKSDFSPVDADQVNLLENYCLAFGIDRDDWAQPQNWRFAPDDSHYDQALIDDIRRRAVEPLVQLRKKLTANQEQIEVNDFVRAVFEFIESVRLNETLGRWIELAWEKGDYTGADEHRQFYDKLVDMLDEMAEIFKGQAMTGQEFYAVMEAGFSQLHLAVIPPTIDQVLVGQIERSRHPDLKVVFLPGCTQRQFPTGLDSEGILTDADRCAAQQSDLEIAPGGDQNLIERKYLAYIAFTRPSCQLWITYPYMGANGSQVQISEYAESVMELFDDVRIETAAQMELGLESVRSRGELAQLLCCELGRDSNYVTRYDKSAMRSLLEQQRSFAEVADIVGRAITYDNRANLDVSLADEFHGRHPVSSAGRLGTFGKCPYRYFAQYMLALRPRGEYKLAPLDLGSFYHDVLDVLVKRILHENLSWDDLDDKQLGQLAQQSAQQVVRENTFIQNFTRGRFHNAFLIDSAIDNVCKCALGIGEMIRAGAFRPVRTEASFGPDEKGLGRFSIDLGQGRSVSFAGRIDRIDQAQANGQKLWIIFDYKTSGDKLNWARLYHGLDVQLPLYLLALEQLGLDDDNQGKVVGAFYVPVQVGSKSVGPDNYAAQQQKFRYKARGMFSGDVAQLLDTDAAGNSDYYGFMVTKDGQCYGRYATSDALKSRDFQAVREFTRRKIVQLVNSMRTGNIDVRPSRLGTQVPCGQCDYKSLCRFDWQINEYNILETKSKTQVLDEIKANDP